MKIRYFLILMFFCVFSANAIAEEKLAKRENAVEKIIESGKNSLKHWKKRTWAIFDSHTRACVNFSETTFSKEEVDHYTSVAVYAQSNNLPAYRHLDRMFKIFYKEYESYMFKDYIRSFFLRPGIISLRCSDSNFSKFFAKGLILLDDASEEMAK